MLVDYLLILWATRNLNNKEIFFGVGMSVAPPPFYVKQP